MKDNIPFPDEKITWFKEKLGIEKKELEQIARYSQIFIEKKAAFSAYFFDYFNRIDETAFLLAHQKHGHHLSKIWENWFELFFKENFSENFLKALWISGLVHVEINIDHRFIMLSYSVLRQFCQRIIRQQIPQNDRESILTIIDKMIDFCLLIETNAFVEATSRCDMEVVRGISHQVRNPLTVIGGNAVRLLRNSDKTIDQTVVPEISRTIIEESRRLEKMVTDAVIYSDMYQKEADHSVILLSSIISDVIKKIKTSNSRQLKIAENTFPSDLKVQGDRKDLELMLVNIIQHCIDTDVRRQPDIVISVKQKDPASAFIEIEILSRGSFQKQEEIEKAFVPFYSSRPDGTGLGLSIAKLAAHKNLGDIIIDPVSDEGTRYIIKLPVSVTSH